MTKQSAIIAAVGVAYALSFGTAFAATPLAATCVGTPTATNITWTASTTGGVTPVTYLWGNGSTLATQTVSAAAGTHSMTLQTTDASSTVAVATCSATVAAPVVVTPTASSTAAIDAQITSIRDQIRSLQKQLRDLLFQRVSLMQDFFGHGKSKGHDRHEGRGSGKDD